MNEPQPQPARDITDETFLPNLATNALPITALLAAMVEHIHPVGLRGMRLRDSWLSQGAAGPQVNFALQLAGDLRGGANSVYWARLRAHSMYVGDEDFVLADHQKPLKGLAKVTFLVPGACAATCQRLLNHVPYMSESPIDKYQLGFAEQEKAGAEIAKRPITIDPAALAKTLRVLVVLVESLRAKKDG